MASRLERVQREVLEWREGWVRDWEKGREREREAGVSPTRQIFFFGFQAVGREAERHEDVRADLSFRGFSFGGAESSSSSDDEEFDQGVGWEMEGFRAGTCGV